MKKINEKIVKASLVYSEQTALRTLINVVPYIGGALDFILVESGQRIIQKRIELLIKELDKRVSKLEESQINNKFVNSEEFFDLIVSTFSKSTKTRHQEKVELYASILSESIQNTNHFQSDETENYLRVIEELSLNEIIFARVFFEIKEIKKYTITQYNESSDITNVENDIQLFSSLLENYSQDDLQYIFIRLERSGLVKEKVGSIIGYSGGIYDVTHFFKQFMKYTIEDKINASS